MAWICLGGGARTRGSIVGGVTELLRALQLKNMTRMYLAAAPTVLRILALVLNSVITTVLA